MATGTVKFYRSERGWGAISSDALPPGRDAWVHYSMIEGQGYRELEAGERVEFDFEEVQQDSFDFRATWVRRSTGASTSP
ncbi:cold shock domain-containing protein [Nakamurella silvestris]|nr:cold shock domain-containing protein [Nakamurella silvestris]